MTRGNPLHRLVLAGLAAGLAVTTAQVARAESYYWHEGSANPPKASYVYRYTYNQPCQQLHQYQTSALSASADTVMHLTVGSSEVAWNNDGGPGLGSQITYFTTCTSGSQQVTIWVRAADNNSGGNPDDNFTYTFKHTRLTSPSATILTDTLVPLGGWLLGGAADVVDASPSDTMETVLTNNGAAATFLMRLRLDSATPVHYRLEAWNQSSGIGVGSKLGGSDSNDELWVIATPTEATREGPVRVVRNDLASGDSDADSLGNNLEAEVCTCRAVGTFYCAASGTYYTCNDTGTTTTKDTDQDGLRDNLELLGKESGGSPPQYLPWWGANPRRRDIFIEMDRTNVPDETQGDMTSESTVVAAAKPFADLAIVNPDGTSGVSTHFDIGVGFGGMACRDENGDGMIGVGEGGVDGITKFCGNMGGANVLTVTPTENCALDIFAMDTTRHGIFRWMVRQGPRNGSTPTPSVCSYLGNGTDGVALVAHELGHQLGIQHNGSNDRMNKTPTYQSLMNYAYDDAFWVDIDSGPGVDLRNRTQFSRGTLAAWPLNPRNLSETADYGGTEPLDFMTAAASGYDFDTHPSFPRRIDWNRDGAWDSSVRAHVVGFPNARDFGGSSMPQAVGQENISGLLTDAAPGAAYSPAAGYSYVVINRTTDHKLAYTRRSSSGGWSNWVQLFDSPTFRADSSPMVVTHDVAGGEKLFVIGVDTANVVQYARYNPHSVAVDQAWTPIPRPANVRFREVNATSYGSRLYVVGTDEDAAGGNDHGTVWLGWFEAGVWQGWTNTGILSAGVAQSPIVTPGIAVGADAKLYMYVRTATMEPREGANWMEMHVYNSATGAWTRTDQAPLGGSDDKCGGAQGRITMIFRPHRTAAGAALASGNGALWTWYSTDCDSTKRETHYRWTWNTFNASVQSFNLGKWHRADTGHGDCSYVWRNSNGAGVAIIDHPDGIGEFFAHTPDDNPAFPCPGGVWSVPYADGEATPPDPAVDYDDTTHIRTSLCATLHAYDGGACWCGEGVACGPPLPSEMELCYDDPRYFGVP
jgi:hypothetical protein